MGIVVCSVQIDACQKRGSVLVTASHMHACESVRVVLKAHAERFEQLPRAGVKKMTLLGDNYYFKINK